MSTVHPLPRIEEVSNTFSTLFGEDSSVEETDQDQNISYVAIFVNDADEPVTAISCDVKFAAYLGAALTMIPAAGAEDAVQENCASEMMLANVQEIMNIASRWFMTNESPHLRLTTMYTPEQLPEETQSVMSADGRSSFEVNIPDYGRGQITCMAL